MSTRPAGLALIEWANTPMGEEILEGVGAGLLMGIPAFVSRDTHKGEAALQTASAIAGAIGMGMAGRRIGARIGKRVHKDEVKNPAISAFGGLLGNEGTTIDGIANAARSARKSIAEGIAESYEANLRNDIAKLKIGGMTPDEFIKNHPGLPVDSLDGLMRALEKRKELAPMRKMVAAVQDLDELTPEQRSAMIKNAQAHMNKEINQTADMAASTLTPEKVDLLKAQGIDPEAYQQQMNAASGHVRGVLQEPTKITGEHVGRALGRLLGDEIGAIAGWGLGGLAAGAMGLQSPKDMEIARLTEELNALR